MLSYSIGIILGAIMQPSTILVIILSSVLSKSKKSLIIVVLILACIAQLILKLALGSTNIFTIIITFFAGYISISLIYLVKKEDKNSKENNRISRINPNLSKFLKILIKLIFSLIVVYSLVVVIAPVLKNIIEVNFHNHLKPKIEGYSKVKYENLKGITYKEKEIDNKLIQYIHYSNLNNNLKELDINESPVNPAINKCIKDKKFNVDCILDNENSLFLEDHWSATCLYTFQNYSVIASNNNNYLLNIDERACGSHRGRWNSYYLISFNKGYIEIKDSVLAGKHPQRKIDYFKINNDNFSFITSICYHGADSCWMQKADWFQFKF